MTGTHLARTRVALSEELGERPRGGLRGTSAVPNRQRQHQSFRSRTVADFPGDAPKGVALPFAPLASTRALGLQRSPVQPTWATSSLVAPATFSCRRKGRACWNYSGGGGGAMAWMPHFCPRALSPGLLSPGRLEADRAHIRVSPRVSSAHTSGDSPTTCLISGGRPGECFPSLWGSHTGRGAFQAIGAPPSRGGASNCRQNCLRCSRAPPSPAPAAQRRPTPTTKQPPHRPVTAAARSREPRSGSDDGHRRGGASRPVHVGG